MSHDTEQTPSRTNGSGIYPKRLSYAEQQRRDALSAARRQARLPKRPGLTISLLLTVAGALLFGCAKLILMHIKPSDLSAVFSLSFVVIFGIICYGTAFSSTRRIFRAFGIGSTLFLLLYVIVLVGSIGLLYRYQYISLDSSPKTLLGLAGGHFVAVLAAVRIIIATKKTINTK